MNILNYNKKIEYKVKKIILYFYELVNCYWLTSMNKKDIWFNFNKLFFELLKSNFKPC